MREIGEQVGALTASARYPLKPPRDWFDTPEPDRPQPLVVHDDGRITGHLAPWSGCHTAYGQCIPPPRSADGYAKFHVGSLETAEGDLIPVGKVMFGGKHASTDPATTLAAATQHYDDNGHVGAYVRAVDGKHGIWLTGAVKHDITPEGLRDLRANPPSGDWRDRNGRHTLIAALAVPVPGFPIEREALAASGELPAALIMSYPVEEGIIRDSKVIDKYDYAAVSGRSKAYLRKRALVASALVAAPLTAKRRNALSRSSFAIPETRSYPIQDASHARNALARSAGKPEEARVRRAVCAKYPDMGECSK